MTTDLRPVRLPRRLVENATDSDLRLWTAILTDAGSRLSPPMQRVADLLAAIGLALLAELNRRAAGEMAEGTTDNLAVDLGDAGSLLSREDRRRFDRLICGDDSVSPPITGLVAHLEISHPIRILLELCVNAAIRSWSDGEDAGRAADQWIEEALLGRD